METKKKVHLPQDAKRLPRTERPTHPPHGRRSAPSTYPPTKLYYIQQHSSATIRTAVHLVGGAQLVGWFLRTLYEAGNKRGEFQFLTVVGHLGERASRHPPPTHPPPTMHPRTYPVQQYSNAAVHRAIHLTGEQQPIRWLQCSRAGRDLQLFTIPHHAGGQAKSARVADSAHGERRRLDAAVIGPGIVVLAVDEGALVVSCPWLCPWLKWPKNNSKVQYSWSSKKEI